MIQKRYFKLLFILLLLLMTTAGLKSAHIVGGDMIYKCLGSNTTSSTSRFEIIMTVYRDSKSPNGATFDNDASIGIWNGSKLVNSLSLSYETPSNVGFESECIELPSNIGVEKAVYRFILDLPWSNDNYLIAYQRCCRNGTISNIVDPGGTGAVFSVEITPEAQRSCNDSPEFKKFPPILVCLGLPLNFDHSATDAQGDQIVYEFCSPQSSGGKDGDPSSGPNPKDPNTCTGVKPLPIKCSPPFGTVLFNVPTYTEVAPMGGSPVVSINSTTGLITGTPDVLGQFVVGVCVKEFRNGVLLSEIRRDFQFNVIQCKIAVVADSEADNSKYNFDEYAVSKKVSSNRLNIKTCGTKDVYVKNLSTQLANIRSYDWNVNINGQQVQKTSRDADFSFPQFGKYSGKLILNKDSQECSDSMFVDFEIYDKPISDFSFAYDTCKASEVIFTNKSKNGAVSPIISQKWIFENGDTSLLSNPKFFFDKPGVKNVKLITVDANQCVDTVIKRINYFPVPELIVIQPTQFIGCQPASITFTNLSNPIDSTYNIIWDFGDSTKIINAISPSHIYEKLGIYDVRIEITSPIGCKTSRSYADLIEVLEKPKASFEYTPEKPNSNIREVQFTDKSEGASFWFWSFGENGLAYEPNPKFMFPDTGLYEIFMQVSHESGCTDTARALIDVVPITNLFMPNAFTPNNDGKNDEFKGVGLKDANDYILRIWNRWGELIFESKDPQIGWNGEFNNNGVLSPQGVYVYTVIYTSPRGEKVDQKGHVTLIR